MLHAIKLALKMAAVSCCAVGGGDDDDRVEMRLNLEWQTVGGNWKA